MSTFRNQIWVKCKLMLLSELTSWGLEEGDGGKLTLSEPWYYTLRSYLENKFISFP